MTVDPQRMIEELTQEYEKARARTGEVRRQIAQLTATAVSPRESVKVTVGAQGDVRSIEFPTSAYKRMPPAELSEALMAAIGEAREKATGMLSELMAPSMPAGVNFVDLVRGEVKLPSLDGGGPGMPDMVRDYLAGGTAMAKDVSDGE
ncbi:MAG TPA: YbaB/EbfC family nucleoid-associated protein [Trebonia sp.]